jgi:hypothetical protein
MPPRPASKPTKARRAAAAAKPKPTKKSMVVEKPKKVQPLTKQLLQAIQRNPAAALVALAALGLGVLLIFG